MFDFLESIRNTLNAPWGIILSCPIGTVAALHFLSKRKIDLRGARSDSGANKARAVAAFHDSWVRPVGFTLSALLAGGSFLYLYNYQAFERVAALLAISL